MSDNLIYQILASSAVSTGLALALIFLTKNIISERLKNSIKHEYDIKSDEFKSNLKRESDTEIEILKNKLKSESDSIIEIQKAELKLQNDLEIERTKANISALSFEKQTKFIKLHEARAEAIAESYQLLKDFYLKLKEYTKIFVPAGDSPTHERRKIAGESFNTFKLYYVKKMIYFPKSTCDKLEEIDGICLTTLNQFFYQVEMPIENSEMTWLSIINNIDGKIKILLSELEDEFRKLLGDETH